MQALTSVVHFTDTSPSKVDFGQVSAAYQKARQLLSHPQIAGPEVGSKVLVPFFLRYFDKDPRYKVHLEFLRRGGLPTLEDAVRSLATVQARNGPSQAPPVLACPGVMPPREVPGVSSPAPVQVYFDIQWNGVCKRGSSCLYSHDHDAIARAPPLPPLKARSEWRPQRGVCLGCGASDHGIDVCAHFLQFKTAQALRPPPAGYVALPVPVSLLSTLWDLWSWWVWTQDLIEALPLPCR
jgi:hypothetical protein